MTLAISDIYDDRISQGAIFRDVRYVESVREEKGDITVRYIQFPLVVVLTQECDLEQDHRSRAENAKSRQKSNHDKLLLSVLVAPLYNAEHFMNGTHLTLLDNRIMENFTTGSSTRRDWLMRNDILRYHYLNFPDEIPVPDSVIDFKHYFAVSVHDLQGSLKGHFVCRLSPVYREQLSQRFASFLSRIGLP